MANTDSYLELLKGFESFSSGRSSSDVANINRQEIQRSGEIASTIKQREVDTAIGGGIARAGTSGLTMGGSMLTSIMAAQRQGIADVTNVQREYAIESINKKYEGKQAKSKGLLAFGTSAIKAVAGFK